MITLAGIELQLPSRDWIAWVSENIDPAWTHPGIPRTWPAGGNYLPFRGHQPEGPVKLGNLSWPRDASRFATGYFLATQKQVASLRPLAFTGGWNALTLSLADGVNTVSAQMYLLPPRPLLRVTAQDGTPAGGMWLLTLVDQRYRWWWNASLVSSALNLTSWATVYASIGSALGVTITVDTVPSAYLTPPVDLIPRDRPVPLLLDAVAGYVGQRIVCGRDGTVRAMNVSGAKSLLTANLNLLPVLAGGRLQLT